MSDEKRPKKARIELGGSTAPAFARLMVDAMTDEGDTKTVMLAQTLSGARLLDILPRPVLEHMAQFLDSGIDRKPLLVALGRKGPLGSDPAKVVGKWIEAFRWPTCVVDHEIRGALSSTLDTMTQWLPTRPQQLSVLKTLVLRDVFDLLGQRPVTEVRDVFAPLKPHIRHLVLEQNVDKESTAVNALPPSLFCGAALRSISVQQRTAPSFWKLPFFTKWLQTEAPADMALERFEWLDGLWWDADISPLLKLWSSWSPSRRPRHLALATVVDQPLARRHINEVCSSLPDLTSLRLGTTLGFDEVTSCLDRLATLTLTDLQLPDLLRMHTPSEKQVILKQLAASFRQLRQLNLTTPERVYHHVDTDPTDALAPLTDLRYFRGIVNCLPDDPKSWPLLRGLDIVGGVAFDEFNEHDAKRLVRFVEQREGLLQWVDINIYTTRPAAQILTECKQCPWRHVRMELQDQAALRDIQFPVLSTTASIDLTRFQWPADWVERFFPATDTFTRGSLRMLRYEGTSLSLSIQQMDQLAHAARHLEVIILRVDALDIGKNVRIEAWCEALAKWPRHFPRLRSMIVAAQYRPIVSAHDFLHLTDHDWGDVPRVRFTFPSSATRQPISIEKGSVAFESRYDFYPHYVPMWVGPEDG
jgi:hypothetical protein